MTKTFKGSLINGTPIHAITLALVLFAWSAPGAQAQSVPEDVRLAIEAMDLDENGTPKGYMLIEGDIIVPENYYELGGAASTYTSRGDFWPNGNVPYVFDPAVSNANRTNMINAMAEWEDVANVNFFVRNGQANYLYVRNSNVNSSQVGVAGGAQNVNIVSWTSRFIIAHELSHALGYWHEQSRADRNSYVTIDLSNVSQTACNGPCDHNFNIRPGGGGEYGPYDYDSVMHYGECSFSTCKPLCPNDPSCSNGGQTVFANNGTDVGQRNHLSYWETLTTSLHYPYSNWVMAETVCRRFFPLTSICWPDGSFWYPYQGFQAGYDATPTNGRLWLLRNQTYSSAEGLYTKAMLIRAPLSALLR